MSYLNLAWRFSLGYYQRLCGAGLGNNIVTGEMKLWRNELTSPPLRDLV